MAQTSEDRSGAARPDPSARRPPGGGAPALRHAARGARHGRQAGGLPGAGAHHLLPALLVRRRSPRSTPGSSARCRTPRPGPCSISRRTSASASTWAMPSSRWSRAPRIATIPRSWSAPDGRIVGKYRKVHLPGHADHREGIPFQHLEKRYFEVGNLGFPVWRAFDTIVGMMICNDRRWPEAYRVMGLQGVELIAARLQHADLQHLPSRALASAHVPQPPLGPGRRLSEQLLGGVDRQGGRGGRPRPDRAAPASSRRPARSWRRRSPRTTR